MVAGEMPAPQVAAMLLTFNRGQVISIAPSGHYRASPRADELLAYVVETADGQETLLREQFAERFGWKNDPSRVQGTGYREQTEGPGASEPTSVGNGLPAVGPAADAAKVAATLRGGESVAKGDREFPSRSAGTTLGALALVQRPAALPGVESWTIARRSPTGGDGRWQPIALSADGKRLAHAGQDGAVRLIEAASGKVEQVFIGHDAPLAAVAFSPDGKLVASIDSVVGNVQIWGSASGRRIHSVHAGRGSLHGTLHFSPDGAILAVSVAEAQLRLLDVASGEFLPRPIGHALVEPDYFAWSPDGRRFVSTTGNREIRIWDTATLEPARTLESKFDTGPNVAFGWSPDGSTLAAYAGTGEIRVWDPTTGKLLRELKEDHAAWYARLAWLPDSRRAVITTAVPNGAQLWDLAAGEPIGDVLRFERSGYVEGFARSTEAQTLTLKSAGAIGLFDLPSRQLVKEIAESPWARSARGHPTAANWR
ncbi:MAG TPA: hypothetical protein VFW87_20255 [Pirellulales bacterium]|nr:hypothetical protein [Pirellulales bacterium]